MEVFFNEGEKHMQVNDFFAENAEGYHAYWRNLKSKYEGYEIDFCYHNCDPPVEFMRGTGAVLLEKCIEMRLVRENFIPVYGFEATPVTNENFAAFTILHDKMNSGIYWTSERIGRDLSRWCIYMHRESYVLMSLWSDFAEIFAIEAANAHDKAILLSSAAAFAFERGKTGVLIMIDDDEIIKIEAVRSVGFSECGRYIAYRNIVK